MVDVCYGDRPTPVSARLTDDMCYGGCVLWWMCVMVDVFYGGCVL